MNPVPRVLVVDDDPDIRTIVGLNLGLAGMQTGEASNGAEAVAMLSSGDWDACILDLAMPNTDGMTALHQLKDKGTLDEVVVVILSATSSPARAIEGMKVGAHAHLTKPFSPAAVATLVQELIDLTPEGRTKRRMGLLGRAGELERLGISTI
ncbi:MAG TPA: response regulator [Actinomycetota bacterium]|nr:response regulator [Actinomycetota bacterium]